ncbi:aspartyl protease family protein At5g10770-like [Pistacia vera]|uniref:aspartyl protease family protein At5g10770-like n=1 Tax=Pistacia vera TaxID=55513 RepID=UPI001263D7C2|nr:aspartyl protease family protein At5g10770-like [Pistacia vera]
MAITSLLFFFALLFSCYLSKTLVYGAAMVTCSASTKGKFHGLRIASRYGPCSPLAQENSTPDSSQILLKDEVRVRSINSLTSNVYTTLDQDEQKGTGMRLFGAADIGAGNFVVMVGFGTPKQDYPFIFDTGSDVTWMQCKLCSVNCQQTASIYNPAESSTFSNATCSSSPSCNYSINYEDGSYTEGYYIRDTLTVVPNEVFPNFVFGCGQNISHNKFGRAAVLLGLGQKGSNTLLSQKNSKFRKTFCYCLPAADSSRGYLWFGPQSLEACQTSKFTPLVTGPRDSTFYFVNLIGITFGELRLNVSSYFQSSLTLY